jgi:hypothetical protein
MFMSKLIDLAGTLDAEIQSAKTFEEAQRTSAKILEFTSSGDTQVVDPAFSDVERYLLALVILSAAHRSDYSYSLKYMRQLLRHDLRAWRSALPREMNELFKAFIERTAPGFATMAQSGLLARLSTIN